MRSIPRSRAFIHSSNAAFSALAVAEHSETSRIQVRRRMPTFVSDEQFERAGEEATVEENLSRANFVRKTR